MHCKGVHRVFSVDTVDMHIHVFAQQRLYTLLQLHGSGLTLWIFFTVSAATPQSVRALLLPNNKHKRMGVCTRTRAHVSEAVCVFVLMTLTAGG